MSEPRVPSHLTGDVLYVCTLISELIDAVHQLRLEVTDQFRLHDDTLRSEVIKVRQLAELLLGGEEPIDGSH